KGRSFAVGLNMPGAPGVVQHYSLETGKLLREFKGHTGTLTAVVFFPHGKTLATRSDDKTLRLWGVATGKEQRQFAGHEGRVEALTFSPSGRMLASAGLTGGVIRVWDSRTGKELRQLAVPRKLVWSLAFSPNGELLASAGDAVRVWDVSVGMVSRQVRGVWARAVAFSADGRALARGRDK